MSPIVDLILVFIGPVFLGLIGRVLLFALLSFIINSEGDAHHLTTTLQRYIVLLLSSFSIEVLSHLRLCGLYFSTHLYLGLWILSLHTKHATTAASAASSKSSSGYILVQVAVSSIPRACSNNLRHDFLFLGAACLRFAYPALILLTTSSLTFILFDNFPQIWKSFSI